jgi:hypothetical protein
MHSAPRSSPTFRSINDVRRTGRAARLGWALAGLVAFSSCETVEDPFPAQGALNVDVTYTGLGTQLSPPPAPQVVIWSIEEASASDITGFDGEYSFLRSPPCFYPLNVVSLLAMNRACRVSGLSLKQGVERTALLSFRLSAMELRQAARPDLRLGADPDGDGIPNGIDNCPIVPNPIRPGETEQDDVNNDNVGDACSILNNATEPLPTIPDSDLDGVANVIDNCLWYPNPLAEGETVPPDSDRDGIGDACSRIAPVVLPQGGQTFTCAVEFTTRGSIPSLFRLDFAREGVLSCDSGFTGCTLDASKLVAALVGSTETFPCQPPAP